MATGQLRIKDRAGHLSNVLYLEFNLPATSGIEWGFNNGAPWSPAGGYYTDGTPKSSGGPDTAQLWKTTNAKMAGTRRRSFSPTIPTWANHPASKDAALGIKSFWSVKPIGGNRAAFIAGDQDAQMRAFLAAAPADSWGTIWHERQPEVPAAESVAMLNRLWDLKESVNPGIQVGPVDTEYRFGFPSAETADPMVWLPSKRDFIGVDCYFEPWKAGNPPKGFMQQTGFKRWYDAYSGLSPLVIAETSLPSTQRGPGGGSPTAGPLQLSYSDAQCAAWIDREMTVLENLGDIVGVLWWNNDWYSADVGFASYVNDLTRPERPLALAAWNKHAGA
jgi:hypothetical protein